jgi:hypothetical protein
VFYTPYSAQMLGVMSLHLYIDPRWYPLPSMLIC